MTEQQFERRARAWLELGPSQAPTGAVQAALTAIETVPQVRRAGAAPHRRFVYLAAAAALAAALGAAFMIGTQQPQPPTPTPMPSAPVSLPDIAALAATQPPATIRIERSIGPADAPVSSADTTSQIELGPVRLVHGFFVSVACLGPGDMIVSIVEEGRSLLRDIPARCDGGPYTFDFPTQVANEAGYEVALDVTVADGASWRLVLGEYLAEAEAPPVFEDPALTSGWHFMQDVPTVPNTPPAAPVPGSTARPGSAARVQVPQQATRIGVFVQCRGASTLTVTANESFATEVECREDGTARVEFPVIGGEELTIRAVSDRPAWIRLYLESDGEIATTYPTAPLLPEAVAITPYTSEAPEFLAMGTLGSNRQGLIPVPWARPGLAGGDFVAAAIPNEATGAWRLDLFSVSRARVVGTLAEVEAPDRLATSYVDVAHGQVFYLIGRGDGSAEYRRVGLDGTDDRQIVLLPTGGLSLGSNLARDASVLAIEFCREATACVRHIVDADTLEMTTIDIPALPLCRIDAVVGGLIVQTSGGSCAGAEAPFATWATPLDGGERRLLVEGAVERYVVDTTAGPKLVYSTGWTPDAGKTFRVLDVASGETEVLVSFDADSPQSALVPGGARLPRGWILLAGMLNEYPAGRLALGPAPLVINVETGEQIELVNLPHRQP